jgi:hypothetical protein
MIKISGKGRRKKIWDYEQKMWNCKRYVIKNQHKKAGSECRAGFSSYLD